MKARAVAIDVAPLELDSESSDDALLDAVVSHWHERLMATDDRDLILASLGLSVVDATRLRIGLSDRTLGLRLPDRRWKAGFVLRSRLTVLGVLRDSGHEAMRGCVIVPVIDGSGMVVGPFARRTDRTRLVIWADGLSGGVFGDAEGEDEGPLLVVPSITDALVLIGAGRHAVAAPGRRRGFSPEDLSALTRRGRELVVLGRGGEAIVAPLRALGASVAAIASDVDLVRTLASAPDRADALAALLDDHKGTPASMEMSTDAPAGAQGESPGPSLEIVRNDGRDEVFVHSPHRSWRIRGAGNRSNAEGDLLRVALSVTARASGRFHLDTLDLYVARQRAAFVQAAASELRCDRDALFAEFAGVIVVAEQCRDDAAVQKSPTLEMSDAERAQAMAMLCDRELLGRVVDDLGALGVVGETTNLLVCFLATISRLCERPFGVVVQSSSAAGKSTLTDAVCSLVPPEDLVTLSAITSQALYYLGSGDLSRKVLSVAEERGASRAAYALKLLVSEGRLSIATTGKDRASGRLATTHYEVAGPVALVMTTTSTEIDPELENRLVVLGVDESAAQTEAIVSAQRRGATLEGLVARTTRDAVRQRHANAQRLLAPLPVVIPELASHIPATATRYRRDHAKLLWIIAALAVLHQHQRDRQTVTVGDVVVTYLLASDDDVARGLELANRVIVHDSDHLAPQAARLLHALVDQATARAAVLHCEPFEVGLTRRELREALGWSDSQVRDATDRLVALEYLVVTGGGRGRCRTYHYVPPITIRGSSAPVRARRGRTSRATPPGATDEFARFAGLGEMRIDPSTSTASYDKGLS